jgi:hypothetical protein
MVPADVRETETRSALEHLPQARDHADPALSHGLPLLRAVETLPIGGRRDG